MTLRRELHHVGSTTLSTSCPSSTEVTSLVSSCTRPSSVFNAKTRSSVLSAPLNRHYQCTHELSRVSGHFTHCWAYRPVYREMNSLVVKVSKLVHFRPDFWTFARAVLNSRAVCFFNDESDFSLYFSLLDLVQKGLPRRIVVIVLRILCITSTGKFPGCPHSIRHISLVKHRMQITFLSKCNHSLLERFITHNQLRHTSFVGRSLDNFPAT